MVGEGGSEAASPRFASSFTSNLLLHYRKELCCGRGPSFARGPPTTTNSSFLDEVVEYSPYRQLTLKTVIGWCGSGFAARSPNQTRSSRLICLDRNVWLAAERSSLAANQTILSTTNYVGCVWKRSAAPPLRFYTHTNIIFCRSKLLPGWCCFSWLTGAREPNKPDQH